MSLRTIWISSSRNIAVLSSMIELSLDRQHSRQSSFFLYLPVNNVLHRTNANCNDGGSKHRFFLQSEWFSWFWNDDFRAFLVFDSYTFIFILNYPFGGIVFSVDSGPIGDWETLDLTGTCLDMVIPLYRYIVYYIPLWSKYPQPWSQISSSTLVRSACVRLQEMGGMITVDLVDQIKWLRTQTHSYCNAKINKTKCQLS